MSSSYVRTQAKTFIAAEFPTENVIDLTAQYNSITDMIDLEGLTHEDNWLGLQFIGSTEEMISTPANNTEGLYREYGSIYLHVVEPLQVGVGDLILARAEALRDSFRGQRINDIIIEEVAPANFESSATLQFEGGYTAASVIVSYYRDLKL